MKILISISLLISCLFSQLALSGPDIPKDKKVLTTIQGNASRHLNPDSINILVWNLLKGSREGWHKDFKSLTLNTDLTLLQEAFLAPFMRDIFEQDNFKQYVIATSFIYKKKKKRGILTGVATASAAKTLRKEFLRSSSRQFLVRTPKVTLITEYRLKGMKERLLVLNIHGINIVSAKKLEEQLKPAAEVVSKHTGPVIFAGDFNTWSKKKLRILNTLMNNLNMKAVEFDESEDNQRKTVFKHYIDHIFTRGMSFRSSRVWSEIETSDHKAISAELFVTPKIKRKI
jgi:endonuclease/exonuclease/phosphatase (EEP) superfamily protein YafD